jgi:hypothetical protein
MKKTILFKIGDETFGKHQSARTALLLTCAVATFATPTQANSVIFDNANAPLGTTPRSGGNLGTAAYLSIGGSDVAISQIAINAAPGQNGQLKFVIFSDVASPGNSAGPLLFSDTVNVTASGSLNYILSDLFSFSLLAGHFYDIGAVFSGTGISYSYDLTGNTQNGITSIVANQNVDNFANPLLTDHAQADVNIKLFGAATVPDGGATALLLSVSMMSMGWIRRKLN